MLRVPDEPDHGNPAGPGYRGIDGGSAALKVSVFPTIGLINVVHSSLLILTFKILTLAQLLYYTCTVLYIYLRGRIPCLLERFIGVPSIILLYPYLV